LHGVIEVYFSRCSAAVRACAAALVLLASLPAAAAAQARVDWDPRPSIRFGDAVRIDLRLKIQADFRTFSPEQPVDDGTFHLHRRRAGIEGELFGRVSFQIERELREGGPWRDVFANVEIGQPLELRAGKFKIPFGLEETTSTTDLDFVYRTLGSDLLAPARSVGAMAHGRFGRLLEYEAGFFRDDGENARLTEPIFLLPSEELVEHHRSFAARVIATPWGRGGGARPRLGAAMTTTEVPEGLNSLFGHSMFDSVFAERLYIRGTRTRLGFEGEWDPGPLGFRAEYMRVEEERQRQGLGDVDLSDAVARAWYASASWVLTGEEKAGGVRPRRSLFAGGVGAVEVATRLEGIWFGSATDEGPAFTNPRADHVLSNEALVWTNGVNWYVNRWVRLQGNAVREHFDDPNRTPVPGRQTFWSGILRIQVVI
jgi:phosphate-selective porin OprO/OprP